MESNEFGSQNVEPSISLFEVLAELGLDERIANQYFKKLPLEQRPLALKNKLDELNNNPDFIKTFKTLPPKKQKAKLFSLLTSGERANPKQHGGGKTESSSTLETAGKKHGRKIRRQRGFKASNQGPFRIKH